MGACSHDGTEPLNAMVTANDVKRRQPCCCGIHFPAGDLRFARACAVNFTRTVLDMNLGFWPGLLVAAPDPPGDGPRSMIAKADTVDRTNADTAIDKDTVLLRDLAFIFSPIGSGMDTNLVFHGKAEEGTPSALGASSLRHKRWSLHI